MINERRLLAACTEGSDLHTAESALLTCDVARITSTRPWAAPTTGPLANPSCSYSMVEKLECIFPCMFLTRSTRFFASFAHATCEAQVKGTSSTIPFLTIWAFMLFRIWLARHAQRVWVSGRSEHLELAKLSLLLLLLPLLLLLSFCSRRHGKGGVV